MNRRTISGPAGLLLTGLVIALSQVPAGAHAHKADSAGEAHYAHTLVSTQETHLHESALQHYAVNEITHSAAAHHNHVAAQHSDGAERASHFGAASEHSHEATAEAHHEEAAAEAHHEIAAHHHHQD